MEVEINGKEYESIPYSGGYLDLYLYKGVLYDDLPKGATVRQYVTMDDGSIVGICFNRTWKLAVKFALALTAVLLVIGSLAQLLMVMSERKVEKSDVEVIYDSTENAVVSVIKDTDYILRYNRYTVFTDGYIDIMYQNIDKDVTLTISNVECDTINVKAGDYLPKLKVSIPDGTEMPLRGTMIVTIEGDKYTVPIVINDKDSVEYQEVRKEHTSDNRVNLLEQGTEELFESTENSDNYDNPNTYEDVERTIHD